MTGSHGQKPDAGEGFILNVKDPVVAIFGVMQDAGTREMSMILARRRNASSVCRLQADWQLGLLVYLGGAHVLACLSVLWLVYQCSNRWYQLSV